MTAGVTVEMRRKKEGKWRRTHHRKGRPLTSGSTYCHRPALPKQGRFIKQQQVPRQNRRVTEPQGASVVYMWVSPEICSLLEITTGEGRNP